MAEEVDIQVKYSCGCGFNCEIAAEAITHVRASNHALSVLGMLRPVPIEYPEEGD